MALLSSSRVYNDLIDLSVEVFKITRGINRDYRMSIGRRMEDCVLGIADHLLLANSSEDAECVRQHMLAMAEYERLQFLMSTAVRIPVGIDAKEGRMTCISIRQQARLSVRMTAIGKQMTGLRRYAEKKLREKIKGQPQSTDGL